MQTRGGGSIRDGALVLADGSVFEGELFGAVPDDASVIAGRGEVVFNTAMSGYQEVISDPSYAGQIVTFTTAHIGNYGVNQADFESRGLFCRGVVVRDLARRHSSWRADGDLDSLLRSFGIAGIAGVDTRRLTRVIRDHGAMPGAFGAGSEAELRAAAEAEPGTDGIDLVAEVTTPEPYSVVGPDPDAPLVVAYDFGIKHRILHHLAQWFQVDVVPASTSGAEVLARQPAAVFLSNGPGDPATVPDAVEAIRSLLGEVPVFGICLGHQLLAMAIGAEIVKLPFGHHGANHPVRDLRRGTIAMTSQNHNFAVAADSLAGRAEMTHVNLNDGVCEGLRVTDALAWSVQHHPEAGPGPHDSTYLFDELAAVVAAGAAV